MPAAADSASGAIRNHAGTHARCYRVALLGKLAQGGITEIEAGRLAQAKGTAPGVKAFGEMMVEDHSAANEKVKELHMQDGARFDQAYIEAMVKAHEKTVAMLKTEIATGRDADTKALAHELLPTVESHLAEASRLAGKDERAASVPQRQQAPRAYRPANTRRVPSPRARVTLRVPSDGLNLDPARLQFGPLRHTDGEHPVLD